jgi:ABC-type branched-subunit amino acid transport system substrate-binding protein
MSNRHPEVFISATSSDLRSCRLLAKEALLTLGCVPVEQTNFPPDYRTVHEMLRAKVAACDAVIHVAGECYGAEPGARDPEAPRRSYTQMEYDLARELKKPVYVFICGDGFPYDEHPLEDAEKQQLQQAHRALLAQSDTLRYTVLSPGDLSLRVRELQTRVEHLRGELKKTRSWLGRGLTIGLIALAAVGVVLWWLNSRTTKTEIKTGALETELDRQRRYIRAVADVYTKQEAELDRLNLKLSDSEKYSRALAAVAKQENVPESELRSGISLFVAATQGDPKAEYMDRALADFALENFEPKPTPVPTAAPTAVPTAVVVKPVMPGVTDTEIKIGHITTSAGRASAYRSVDRAEAAYFQMVNDHGGVNGRKITMISADYGTDSANAIDLTHKLVEEDKVLLIFSTLGTESNLATRAYMNMEKVPQLFIESSSAVFDDPAHFPWTMGFFPTYQTEGSVYAKYVLKNKPAAKIAVLYADDEAGREYLAGIHDGLGDKASALIVKEVSYENSDSTTTLDAQIRLLQASRADVFFNMSVGTWTTDAIRIAYDLGWHPMQFIPSVSLSVAAFLEPAGVEKATGVIANARSKSWLSPKAQSDPAVVEYLDWMSKYNADASLRDQNTVGGYERAEALVDVLRECGNDLSRANVMKEAANLDIQLGMLRPGIRLKTSPTDYQPIKQMYLIKFNGKNWSAIGSVTSD